MFIILNLAVKMTKQRSAMVIKKHKFPQQTPEWKFHQLDAVPGIAKYLVFTTLSPKAFTITSTQTSIVTST